MRQKTKPFDMAANAEQAPAIVTRHAVGLQPGDGGEVVAGALESRERMQGRVVCASGGVVTALKEGVFGALYQRPVLLGEALAHRSTGQSHRPKVVAHAGSLGAAAQAGDEGALEHPARLRCCRQGGYTGQYQVVFKRHLA